MKKGPEFEINRKNFNVNILKKLQQKLDKISGKMEKFKRNVSTKKIITLQEH